MRSNQNANNKVGAFGYYYKVKTTINGQKKCFLRQSFRRKQIKAI